MYMKIKVIKKNICLWMMLLTLFLTTIPRVSAQDPAARTIRVAYPIQPGLTEYDEYGANTGYTYEFLEEIAQYTGWDYQFVSPETGETNQDITLLLQMLKDGEIDLMGGIGYLDSTAEEYDYSAYSYGTVYTVLQTLYDSDQNNIITSNIPQTFRIAVLKTSVVRRQELEEYCKINLVEPVYVECDSIKAQIDALRTGEADFMLNTSMNYIENLRTVAKFSARPFYFITTKGNTGIMEALNAAIISIDQADPSYTASLYEKYFEPKNHRLFLSEKEKEYIAAAGVLKVGVLTAYPPYQYALGGEYKGIGADLLRYVSEKTGLQFEWIPAGSPEELFRLASSEQVSLIAGMPYNYTAAQENNLSMSRPFISSQYFIVMNNKSDGTDLSKLKLAFTTDLDTPGADADTFLQCRTLSECMEAIAQGKADYTYLDTNTAQYYLNQPKYRALRLIPQSYESRKVCFGVVKTGSRELLSILNKVVLTIPEIELQTIINQNILVKQPLSFKDYIRENPLQIMVFTLCSATAIIAVLLIFLYQRAKAGKNKKLELEKHYKIYALTKDYFMEYNYFTKKLLVSIPPDGETGEPELTHYDFNTPPANAELLRRRTAFLEVIGLKKRCIKEACLPCIDGRDHWLRFALDIIYDNGVPAFAVGKINIIDKEKEKEAKLLQKAQLDSLTHIYNPETTQQKIAESLRALPEQNRCALLILDIDYFKVINDTFGHMCGDETLQQVATLLKAKFCPGNIVGRMGGDEFIIYIKNAETADALSQRCAALQQEVRRIKSGSRIVTVSIGAVLCSPAEQSYESLYKRADEMLYKAKAEGRDQFSIWEC